MRNSLSIINWPLRASTAPTEPGRATHPQTPYQPHNGYRKEYQDRKRLIITLVGLAFSLFSLVASITLYILVGVKDKKGGWVLRTWIVVSAGLSALLESMAASYYYNHMKVKREDRGDECGTELRALGRREIEQNSQSITRVPLVREPGSPSTVLQTDDTTENEHQLPGSAVTVLHRPDSTEIRHSSPATAGYATNSLDSQAALAVGSPTYNPPPRFPSPAKLRDQTRAEGDASFHTSPSAGSPDTMSSNKSPEALLARNDSLKRLREATLRRKQALESLK